MRGKIEKWHQSLKSEELLESYYLPSGLDEQIEMLVER